MALTDALKKVEGKGPARENRVALLLDKLAGSEDAVALDNALTNPKKYSSSNLTQALRNEYGQDAVTNTSVAEYRRRYVNVELSGL